MKVIPVSCAKGGSGKSIQAVNLVGVVSPLDVQESTQTFEGIKRGLADVEGGRTRPAEEVFKSLQGKHEISD